MRPLYLLALLALVILFAGCHLVFPHRPVAADGGMDSARGDRGVDRAADDLPFPVGPELGPPICGELDSDTISLYRFDDPLEPGRDTTSRHSFSTLVGTVSQGQGRCGLGLHLEPKSSLPSHAVIAPSSDWDKVRSIELWARFDRESPPYAEGILSRDAAYTDEPGHFTMVRDCAGRILFRLQQTGSQPEHHICSSRTIGKDQWTRIVVNFHPLELRVDGDSSLSNASTCAGFVGTCQAKVAVDLGIEGNKNPWVLGGICVSCANGGTSVVSDGMAGTIDELRLSSVRR